MKLHSTFYDVDPCLLFFGLWPEVSSDSLNEFPSVIVQIVTEYGDPSDRKYTILI
jgi:hypothetical protein